MYKLEKVISIPIGPIDPKSEAYMGAYVRLMTNAFSIQSFYGCSIERAKAMAREQLSDADRALVAANAEAIERLALPAPRGEP